MTLDIIAAGELYIDLIMSGFDRWPAPGQEAFARDLRREPGGIAITAMGLAKLGLSTGVVGAVGEDGGWLVERLSSAGVDTSAVRVVEGFTGTTVAISGEADRALLTYRGASRSWELGSIDARHLHWATAVNRDVLERAHAQGLTISLDVGFGEEKPDVVEILPLVDLFFSNEVEAERITGERDAEAMLRWFEKAGARCVVLKLGARGAAMLAEGQLLRAAPPDVLAVDTTGAGDCFAAGFLCAWLKGEAPEACLKLGNVCGGLSTRLPGGQFPSKDEIDAA